MKLWSLLVASGYFWSHVNHDHMADFVYMFYTGGPNGGVNEGVTGGPFRGLHWGSTGGVTGGSIGGPLGV